MSRAQSMPVGTWVNREFDFIPVAAIEKLYYSGADRLACIHREDERMVFMPMTGMFHPRERELEERIRERIDIVVSLGFSVYESVYFGLLLSVDEDGHLFYQPAWDELQEVLSS